MQESLAEIVARAGAARRVEHGARAGRLLAGHPRRRPRRLPRIPVLAPMDVRRSGRAHAARVPPRVAVAQPGADLRRLLPRAHHAVGRRSSRVDFGPLAGRPTGRSTGPPAARATPRLVSPLGTGKQRDDGRLRPRRALPRVRAGHRGDARRHRAAGRHRVRRRRRRRRRRVRHAGDATCAPRCAASGPTARKVGCVRPISLVPFPTDAIAAAADGARAVAVYENNQGQMIDDVRLAVLGRCPVAVHRRPQPRRLGLRHRARSRRRPRCARRIEEVLG